MALSPPSGSDFLLGASYLRTMTVHEKFERPSPRWVQWGLGLAALAAFLCVLMQPEVWAAFAKVVNGQ
jgi:hypothetical protein